LSRLQAEGLIRIDGKRCIIPSLEAMLDQQDGQDS
jgi:hypothetical protein